MKNIGWIMCEAVTRDVENSYYIDIANNSATQLIYLPGSGAVRLRLLEKIAFVVDDHLVNVIKDGLYDLSEQYQ